MIRLSHISKRYDDHQVLTDFSLALHPGITCLMGASGAGKTTLLRILTGLEMPDLGAEEGLPRRIAMGVQEDRLTESLTVRGNLRLALGKRYDEAAAQRMLDALQLPGVLSQGVSSLSGGMKRRVALCRALMYDADFLVLDEPFKGLDEETKKAVMDVLKAKSAGKTVLLVTHDEDEARYLGASVMRL